jgi:hypothetical protein
MTSRDFQCNIRAVTRFCIGCRQPRPLREFDLSSGTFSTTCIGCSNSSSTPAQTNRAPAPAVAGVDEHAALLSARAQQRLDEQHARRQRKAQLAMLEKHRRELLAPVIKLDFEIKALRSQPLPSLVEIAVLENRRHDLLAGLAKIDTEIAELRARPTPARIVYDATADELS